MSTRMTEIGQASSLYVNNFAFVMLHAFVEVDDFHALELAHSVSNFDCLRAGSKLLEQLAVYGEVNPVVEVWVAFNSNHIV